MASESYVDYGGVYLPWGLADVDYLTLIAMGGSAPQGAPGSPPASAITVIGTPPTPPAFNVGGLGTPNSLPATLSQAKRRAEVWWAYVQRGVLGATVELLKGAKPWSDPTVKHIKQLHPTVGQMAYEFVRRARVKGIPLWISSSLRSATEQRALVAAGRSQTTSSYHLAGRAIDVDVRSISRADLPASFWNVLGPMGEGVGFRWGGRWTSLRDFGHFER